MKHHETLRGERSPILAIALSLGLLLISACSDDPVENPTDGSVGKDAVVIDDAGGNLPDGYKLWPCSEPGKACNAHDPCAIDPICGNDKKCRPRALQDCRDGLDCTTDSCKGMGLCSHTPKDGTCALPVKQPGSGSPDAGVPPTTVIKCFKKGDKKPSDVCQVCDPDTDKLTWSGANGGSCDDGNACTKNDYCQVGTCKGTYYGNQCADAYGCTDDLCDGKGGCLGNKLKKDWCLINGQCFKDKTMNPTGTCEQCDVTKSQSSWTKVTNTCQIDSKCWAKGSKHPQGCGECDPTVSTTEWSIYKTHCYINKTCYKAGAKDAINCSTCDPTTSQTAWTPISGLCKIDGKCYSNGDKHPGGCAECDTTVSTSTWTVKGSFCLINNTCYKPKDKDSTGCGECDPTKSTSSWSAVANSCLIGGKCYTDKQKDSTGCLVCDITKSTTAWTPLTGVKTTDYTFESGKATGWTLTNSSSKVGWQVSSNRSAGGSYSLYYGDPSAKNYDDGSNKGTAAMPAFTPTTGKKAGVRFWLYMDTESSTSYDTFKVLVNGTTVWEKDKTQTVKMKTWFEVAINLSSYAGTKTTVSFVFDTVDSVANSTEGVFIDDITIYDNC